MQKLEESQILLQRNLINKFDDFQSQVNEKLKSISKKLNQEVFDRE